MHYILGHFLITHTENDHNIRCSLNTNLVLYLNLIYQFFTFVNLRPYNIFSPIAFGELKRESRCEYENKTRTEACRDKKQWHSAFNLWAYPKILTLLMEVNECHNISKIVLQFHFLNHRVTDTGYEFESIVDL